MTESKREIRTLANGEELFKEGDAGNEAYLITDGYVAIWRTEGDTRIDLGTRAEGEIVGEMSLIDTSDRSATVTAGSELVVEVITRDSMDAMLAGSPELLRTILHQFMESLRNGNEMISMYGSTPDSRS